MNSPKQDSRNEWLLASDEELLRHCRIEACKASGPGGQHVNKTSSAIRLVHLPSGLSASSSESRSQHENRLKSLRKLRLAIALNSRSQQAFRLADEDMELSPKNKRYHLWIAAIFDQLELSGFQSAPAAAALGFSTSRLNRLLARDAKIWQAFNCQRQRHGLPPLSKH
ncbi:MAG: hypothetical protein A2X49_03430 [Lentisphaerae bacterium GWF2_52_8]|nr:MAG: hypothetical protein A2X49_03430 [Lentisphaerae bacterium GWF2_52_8]